MADGGEGTLLAMGGPNRDTLVAGPLGAPVRAPWRLDPTGQAIIESATACGLHLVGRAEGNDPVNATTRGVGELIVAAVSAGARRLLVGVGGSATTDGGAGAAAVIEAADLKFGPQLPLLVCCDVTTRFTDAVRRFGAQKGASPDLIEHLTRTLAARRDQLLLATGVDVDLFPGSGAAGGLAGGLVALGAQLVSGFDAISDANGLDAALIGADLVVTGEARFDATSLEGKVVGGVIHRARSRALPVLVVTGSADPDVNPGHGVVIADLTAEFGLEQSLAEPTACVRAAVGRHLAAISQ